MDLMQNCDLPPPMKVFMGSDITTVVSSMNNRIFSLNMGACGGELDDNPEKLELLKALRLSQTRAREAKKKTEVLEKERDCLSKALLEEAKLLFAHRQWVRLLELQVSSSFAKCAEKQNNQALRGDHEGDDDDDDDHDDGVCVTCVAALAFCFGIAGVGFAFGCRRFL